VLMPSVRREVQTKLKEISKKHDLKPYQITAVLKDYPFTEMYPWLANFMFYVIHVR